MNTDRTTADRALDAALAHVDTAELTAILAELTPAELYALADAAARLRRECESVYGGQGHPVPSHHGRTRWDFRA